MQVDDDDEDDHHNVDDEDGGGEAKKVHRANMDIILPHLEKKQHSTFQACTVPGTNAKEEEEEVEVNMEKEEEEAIGETRHRLWTPSST